MLTSLRPYPWTWEKPHFPASFKRTANVAPSTNVPIQSVSGYILLSSSFIQIWSGFLHCNLIFYLELLGPQNWVLCGEQKGWVQVARLPRRHPDCLSLLHVQSRSKALRHCKATWRHWPTQKSHSTCTGISVSENWKPHKIWGWAVN